MEDASKPQAASVETGGPHFAPKPRAARASTVLVVEDDPYTRAARASALAEGGVAVIAMSYADVGSLPHEWQPAVVVAAPPAKPGGELGPKLASWRLAAVITPAEGGPLLRPLLPAPASLTTLAQFHDHDRLRRAVDVCLGRARTVDNPFSLVECVQLAGLGGHSVGLRCRNRSGEQAGEVGLVKGAVHTACCGQLRGFPAFCTLVTQVDLIVEFAPVRACSPPEPGLTGNWQTLVLQAMRLADEGVVSSERPIRGQTEPDGERSRAASPRRSRVPSALRPLAPRLRSEPPPEAPGTTPGASARELVDEGVRAVIAQDYRRAVELLERASRIDPSNRAVRHQLQRLNVLRGARENQSPPPEAPWPYDGPEPNVD